MKTKIISAIALAAAVVGLSACSDDWNPSTSDTGKVSFELMGVEVSGVEQVVSRAEVDINDYIVSIYDKDDMLVRNWAYKDVPGVFELPVADGYRIDIASHKVKPSAWDEPLFKGSQTFDIHKNQITNIGNIKCTFASLKVSIRYTQAFLDAMSDDSKVIVEAGKTDAALKTSLEYTPAENRDGFFEVIDGSMTLVATFKGSIYGNEEQTRKVYTDVEPGKHYIITFSLKKNDTDPPVELGPNGNVGVSLTVNNVVDNEDINVNVDPSDDPIIPDDPSQEQFRDKVTFYPGDLSFTDEIPTSPAPANAKVIISAPAGLISLNYLWTSDNADAAALRLADFGLPMLANGETELTLDFAPLIARLAELPGLHEVTVSAEDADANRMQKSLKLRTRAESGIRFEPTQLKLGEVMDPADYDDGVVNITVPDGVAHLKVNIDPSQSFKDALDDVGMPLDFDLAYPDGNEAVFESLKLAYGADVLGKTEVKFDITQFLSLLVFPGQQIFTITVEDKSGNIESCQLIFVKP